MEWLSVECYSTYSVDLALAVLLVYVNRYTKNTRLSKIRGLQSVRVHISKVATYVLGVTVPRRTVARLEDRAGIDSNVFTFTRVQRHQIKASGNVRAIEFGAED